MRSRCLRHPLDFEDNEGEPADLKKQLFFQVQTQPQLFKSEILISFLIDPLTTPKGHFLKFDP